MTSDFAILASGLNIGQTGDAQDMDKILGLQALEVSEEEEDFFGNSCTSSQSNCCNS
jgi:hypothetical protein